MGRSGRSGGGGGNFWNSCTPDKVTPAHRCPPCIMVLVAVILKRLAMLFHPLRTAVEGTPRTAVQRQHLRITPLRTTMPATAIPGISSSMTMRAKAGDVIKCSKSIMLAQTDPLARPLPQSLQIPATPAMHGMPFSMTMPARAGLQHKCSKHTMLQCLKLQASRMLPAILGILSSINMLARVPARQEQACRPGWYNRAGKV